MIIKSKHHPFFYNFFKFYTKWKIGKCFHEVIISGKFQEENKPLLLISNHVSWWDGFWVMYLNMKFFKRKFHFMMLEEQLIKHPNINNVGGYSVKKKSRSIIETINYTTELLSNHKNMVLIFPQGEIQSLYTHPIQFEKGFNNILKAIKGDVQILFITNLIDYFSNPKPSLYMYFEEYDSTDINAEQMQSDFNLFYDKCISVNLQKKEA